MKVEKVGKTGGWKPGRLFTVIRQSFNRIQYTSVPLAQRVYLIFHNRPSVLQGVPKVRSSNFMHCNFWSKLYFYMKFLEDVYFSIKYMCSEFQSLACPFCFFFFITFCSRRGMNWDTACRPTNDPFWAFLSPGAQDPVQPPNNTCLVQAAEKHLFWAFIQKR